MPLRRDLQPELHATGKSSIGATVWRYVVWTRHRPASRKVSDLASYGLLSILPNCEFGRSKGPIWNMMPKKWSSDRDSLPPPRPLSLV